MRMMTKAAGLAALTGLVAAGYYFLAGKERISNGGKVKRQKPISEPAPIKIPAGSHN